MSSQDNPHDKQSQSSLFSEFSSLFEENLYRDATSDFRVILELDGEKDEVVEWDQEKLRALFNYAYESAENVRGKHFERAALVSPRLCEALQSPDTRRPFFDSIANRFNLSIQELRIAKAARNTGQERPMKMSRRVESPSTFPSPPNLEWEEISVTFVSNDSVRVKARDVTKRYHFAEMGFADRRKGDVPTSRWRFLKEGFARHEGEVSWVTPGIEQKERDRLKGCVKDIRAKLRTFFGLDDDPFFPYRKVRKYK